MSNSVERVKDTFSIFQLFFQFQRKYTWFSRLNLQVTNWLNDNSSTINSSSICLSGGSWQIIGVNLIIQDSYFENFKLFFSGRSPKGNKQWKYHSNLTFINTFYTYSNYTGSESLFVLKIANAVFINTTMQNINNIGHISFLAATLNSTVNFRKSHVVKNSLHYSLISVSNFSVIILEDSLVEHNSGSYTLVSVCNSSSLVIEDSVVRNNCMAYTIFLNTNDGHIIVERTKFAKNRISHNFGFCFAAYNNVTLHVFNTTFMKINFKYFTQKSIVLLTFLIVNLSKMLTFLAWHTLITTVPW